MAHKFESKLEYVEYRRKLKPTLGDQLLYKLESDIASPRRNLEVELGSL